MKTTIRTTRIRTTGAGVRLARKTAACFLAAVGLWLAGLAAPATVWEALPTWTDAGGTAVQDNGLSLWQKLLLGESPLLAGWRSREALAGVADETPSPDGAEYDAHEDPQTLTPPSDQGIVAKTLTGGAGYLTVGGVYLHNRTEKNLDVAALAAAPMGVTLSGDGPQVLIMHTHGSEAYAQEGDDVYQESDTARTTDASYNITRIGDEVARIFTEMGIEVLHDKTLYDYPAYSGAYERSRAGIEEYLANYPSIQVVLDIHRDALVDNNGTIYKTVADVDGSSAAQILLVVGTDDGGLSHPDWQKNLALALDVQRRMESLWPGLARPIALRSSRFNQQLTTGSLLVEVGTHGNTLQEALRGARLFARAMGQTMQNLPPAS